jgi:hypothetical protein
MIAPAANPPSAPAIKGPASRAEAGFAVAAKADASMGQQSADHDRLGTQVRGVAVFDGGVECIHVDIDDLVNVKSWTLDLRDPRQIEESALCEA